MSVKTKTIFLHITIWAIVFLLPYVFNSEYNDSADDSNDIESRFIYLDTITKVFWVMLFYLNAWVLIPVLFYKKKYLLYITVLIAFFAVTMQIHGLFFNMIMEGRTFNFFRSSSHNILAFLFTIAISFTTTTTNNKECLVVDYKSEMNTIRLELVSLLDSFLVQVEDK